jgi:hypothetical protein
MNFPEVYIPVKVRGYCMELPQLGEKSRLHSIALVGHSFFVCGHSPASGFHSATSTLCPWLQ